MSWFFSTARRFPRSYYKRIAGSLLAVGGTASVVYGITHTPNTFTVKQAVHSFPLMAQCAQKYFPQSSVINGTKNHALYLTIHLNPGASVPECLKALGLIRKLVDKISPPDVRDESDEIWYGVGFGPKFMDKIKPESRPNGITSYNYRARSGPLGDLPSTDGDIFIHAKCDEQGKLFELCQAVIRQLPHGSVDRFEDIYGWVYRGGRDLTGFIDGTENPADEDDRIAAAIDPKSGGSYVVTQKWIHNHEAINSTKDNVKEQYIGRDITDSTELRKKSITSHVARMVGSADFDAPAKYQIVRHSQPWGTVSGHSGLFFIAYSATPVALDWMLDRMTGKGDDKHADDVMRLTQCVTGNYWYFPSQPEFEKLVNSAAGGSFRLWR